MKKRILSFVLVMTMLMTYSPFAFAEGLDLESSDDVINENLEINSDISSQDEVDLGGEELDADKEQIFSDPVYSVDDDTDIMEGVLGEDFSEDSTESTEEDLESDEDTVQSEDENLPEDTSEGNTEESDGGIGSMDLELDSEFGVDSEETGIGSMDLESGDAVIDTTQDDSGYIVIETPEDAYEGLDINGPTATEEDPSEEVDPGYTISAEEEVQGQAIARDPLIFKIYDGLTLYRSEDGTIAASDYTCTNSTGVDVCLIGVEVVPVNGWEMVGYEADFKNMKMGTREFRLTVNNQVILDYDEDGFIPMSNPIIYFDGEEISVPMELEIGPFKDGLNEGLFSFVLVFEEIIKDEPIQEEVKSNTSEVTEENKEKVESQEESKEQSEETTQESQVENKESAEGTEVEGSEVGEDIDKTEDVEKVVEKDVSAENTAPADGSEEDVQDIENETKATEGLEEGSEETTEELVVGSTEEVADNIEISEETDTSEVVEQIDAEKETPQLTETPESITELMKAPDEPVDLGDVQFVQASAELAEIAPVPFEVEEIVEEVISEEVFIEKSEE